MIKGCKIITILISVFLFLSCSKDEKIGTVQPGPVKVGFWVGDKTSKTYVLPDGVSTSWESADEVALWAKNGNNEWALNAQKFIMMSYDGPVAFFTSTLQTPMEVGSYQYRAVYPYPQRVDGTTAFFKVPSVQSGKADAGSSVMLSDITTASELTKIADRKDEGLNLSMHHLTHLLRLYVPESESSLVQEPVKKIVLQMPGVSVGEIAVNMETMEVQSAVTTPGSVITIVPDKDYNLSPEYDRDYLYASVIPAQTAYSSDDEMVVELVTSSKIIRCHPIPLTDRTFEAGHATSVRLKADAIRDIYKLNFVFEGNDLGEDPYQIRISSADGLPFDDGTTEYVINAETVFTTGSVATLTFENENIFTGLLNKELRIVYESESATCEKEVVTPSSIASSSVDIPVRVPFLMDENFSSVGTFASNDAYTGGFSTGDKAAVEFLSGWSGGRIGGSQGKSVRLASRRETSARYAARMDSEPLKLKKSASLKVTFNYSGNRQEGGIGTKPQIGQYLYLGYVNNHDLLSSGNEEGTFESGNSLSLNETTGSYDVINHYAEFTLSDVYSVPGEEPRISFRTMCENRAGTTNTTSWMYFDNIRVSIVK